MAMEFCIDWLHQHSVLCAVLRVLSESEPRQESLACRTPVHYRRRRTTGRPGPSGERCAPPVLIAATSRLGSSARVRIVQLHLLSATYLAPQLSFQYASR